MEELLLSPSRLLPPVSRVAWMVRGRPNDWRISCKRPRPSRTILPSAARDGGWRPAELLAEPLVGCMRWLGGRLQ
jgi:hypothetical protein